MNNIHTFNRSRKEVLCLSSSFFCSSESLILLANGHFITISSMLVYFKYFLMMGTEVFVSEAYSSGDFKRYLSDAYIPLDVFPVKSRLLVFLS